MKVQRTTGGHEGLACQYSAGVLCEDYSKQSTPPAPKSVWDKAEAKRRKKAKLAGGQDV